MLVFDLFTGMDGFGHALAQSEAKDLVGRTIAIIQFETDPYCRALLHEHARPGVSLSQERDRAGLEGSVLALVEQGARLVDVFLEQYPNVRHVHVVAGSPCQGLSRAGLGRGLDDERSRLVWVVPYIVAVLRRRRRLSVGFLLENVDSMPPGIRDGISRSLGTEPVRVDASDFVACDRPRLFWTSAGHPASAASRGTHVDAAAVLEAGWRPLWELVPRGAPPRHRFRTFLRPFPAGSPVECPLDYPRLPMSSYEERSLVYKPEADPAMLDRIRHFVTSTMRLRVQESRRLREKGSKELLARTELATWIHREGGDSALRPLSGDERDRALGFPAGASAATTWRDPDGFTLEFRRWQVTGNAFSPVVVRHVLQPFIAALVGRRPVPDVATHRDFESEEQVLAALRPN